MTTKIVTKEYIPEAAKCLNEGGTVVFPTETVYGLGADAFNADAVKKIFVAKGRPGDNPLIIHISDISQLPLLAKEIPDNAVLLAKEFWPGPLTMIFKKTPQVINEVTAGLDTVAVRYPSNLIAHDLIEQSMTVIAAPSANLSGSPSPTVCSDVVDDLNGRVDYIIDGTGCEIGLESTVVDVSDEKVTILRPGAITLEMIREFVPNATLDGGLIDNDKIPKCPGLKYTHYSPNADVIVVQGNMDNVRKYISCRVSPDIGVITYKGGDYPGAGLVLNAGDNMTSYAHNLFTYLRRFDKNNIKTVYAEFSVEDGIGVAVRNRLYKACGHKIIEV
ncbi:MAG: threonylcarbamoyl-AMP synthase [Clostridia bacterium]|nr:threonylcarbamoyl-AMP synthase [Clostridia bacterium]